MKKLRSMFRRIGNYFWEFPENHPDLPLAISIIALIASIAMPLLRRFLEGMT